MQVPDRPAADLVGRAVTLRRRPENRARPRRDDQPGRRPESRRATEDDPPKVLRVAPSGAIEQSASSVLELLFSKALGLLDRVASLEVDWEEWRLWPKLLESSRNRSCSLHALPVDLDRRHRHPGESEQLQGGHVRPGDELLLLVLDRLVFEEEPACHRGVRARHDVEPDVHAAAKKLTRNCHRNRRSKCPRTPGLAQRSFQWSQPGSNRRPLGCHPSALPTELWPLERRPV